jgi:hypothetical protein
MRMRRLLTAGGLGLLAVLLLVMPAAAGVTWCRADPIVELGGTEVQVWVAMDEQYEHLVTGPIRVTFYSPNKISKKTTFLDAGFNGYGEEVIFKHRGKVGADGAFPVEIKVRVPLDNRQLFREYGVHEVPILVEVLTGDGQVIDVDGSNLGTSVSLRVLGTE